MINRRETFRLGGGIATLAALAGTAVLAASCDPIPAPAAEHDPMLDALRTYRRQLDFASIPIGRTDEEVETLMAETYGRFWDAVSEGDVPEVTSEAGALECIRIALDEGMLRGFQFEVNLLRAALAFFDGEKS